MNPPSTLVSIKDFRAEASPVQWNVIQESQGRTLRRMPGVALSYIPHGLIGMLVVAIMLPLAAMLVRSAISRAREYQADTTGAQNCRNPLALANALEKLEARSHRRPMEVDEAVPHLFIVNPLSGITASLFSTHPPVRDRVARLRQMRG